ncbi:hypothetical protein BSKO_13779 [Bryopsis sp. KO-2023]|nr:hypothetical protein BSKO_13779 [Bryopsis sp. KO-2023]
MANRMRSNPLDVVGRSRLLGVVVFVFLLVAEDGQADQGGWRVGRATYYGENHDGNNDGFSIHHGSCQFGKLDPHVGTGWDIAAIPDAHPDYQGSCGKCYELACEGMVFSDNYGESIDRRDACRSGTDTVIVTVVDSCPCQYAQNMYSNQRWCCGDMDHFDISIFAFEKLASMSNGVIGLKYRPVPCPSYDEFMPTDPNVVLPQMNEQDAPTKKSNTRVSRESSSDSTSTKVAAQPESTPTPEFTQGKAKKATGVTIVSSDPLRLTTGAAPGVATSMEEEPEPEEKSAAQKARELAKKVLREELAKDQPNRNKVLAKTPVKKTSPLPPPSLADRSPLNSTSPGRSGPKPVGGAIVVTAVLRPPKSKAPQKKEGKPATGKPNSGVPKASSNPPTPVSRNVTRGSGELAAPPPSVTAPSTRLSNEEDGGSKVDGKPAGVLTRLSRSSSSDKTPTRGGTASSGPVESRVQAMVVPTIVSPQTGPASVNATEQEIIGDEASARNGRVNSTSADEISIEVEGGGNGVLSGPKDSPIRTPVGAIEIAPTAERSDVNGTKSSPVEKSTKTKDVPKSSGLPKKPVVKKRKPSVQKRSENVIPTKSTPPVSPTTKPKAKVVLREVPVVGPLSTANITTNGTTEVPAPSRLPFKGSLKCSAGAGPIMIFEGGFDECFVDGGLVRYTPINSNGFGGRSAWCSVLGPRRSVAAVSLGQGAFRGKTKLDFYLFVQHGCPDIAIYLVGKQGACGPINVKDQNPGSERSGYKKFSIDLGLSEFEGCASTSAKDVFAVSFKNNLDIDQGVCLEEIKLY